jgi:hypothetical protein
MATKLNSEGPEGHHLKRTEKPAKFTRQQSWYINETSDVILQKKNRKNTVNIIRTNSKHDRVWWAATHYHWDNWVKVHTDGSGWPHVTSAARVGEPWQQYYSIVYIVYYVYCNITLLSSFVMKRKLEQWSSTIPPISTKPTITTHFTFYNNI